MRHNSSRLLLILLLSFALAGCGLTPEQDKTLNDLRRLAAETPVYQGFNQIDSSSVSKDMRTTLDYYYESSASYSEVRSFYLKELTARGWSKFEESTYGANTEGIQFRKGAYIIAVFHSSPRAQNWDYALSYTWEKP